MTDYQKGELQRLRALAAKSFENTIPWSSPWIVLFGMFFVIGFAVLGAQKIGLVAARDVPPSLFTAYAAYATYAFGVGLVIVLFRRRQQQLARAAVLNTERDDVVWDFRFTDAGIGWSSDGLESHISWHIVKSLETSPTAVFIWLRYLQNLSLPARLFADDASRRAFAAAVRTRIDVAAKS
jgi:hypothetical protein